MRRWAFHAEALVMLTLASLLIAILPFRRVARIMQGRSAARPVAVATARRIDRTLGLWAKRVPWHAMCFKQGSPRN